MNRFVIFLNELSCVQHEPISAERVLSCLLATLEAVRHARRIRGDLALASQVPITKTPLGDGTHSFATILRGDAHKDEWRFIASLDQMTPWDACPGLNQPHDLEEVNFQGQTAIGMLWARKNGSTVLSFGFRPECDQNHVRAQLLEIDAGGDITSTDISVPNLSKPEHVRHHHALVTNFGNHLSPSSVIHAGDGFVVRMFFHDHEPPHFHVLARRDTSETLAKLAITTLDILAGKLSPVLRRRVKEWAEGRREDLVRNWGRCRFGEHPFLLD